MALILLRVLVLGVIAAAADDVNVTWSAGARAALPCVVPDRERVRARRPPPPLDAGDRPRARLYTWRHGDVDVPTKRISPNGTLEVSRRRDGSGEGAYQCGARHYGGLVLGYPVHLKFASIEKEFWLYPENDTAVVGQPFAMFCLIRSGPPASVSWLRDDRSLPHNTRYHMLTNKLLITDVQKEDAGLYKCVATNAVLGKSRTSPVGRLEVQDSVAEHELAFLQTEHEGNITRARGGTVVLPCPVVGSPRPKLTWRLTPPDGRPSELEFTGEVLELTNLEDDQEGVYTCSVENSPLTKVFNVCIVEPPAITIPPSSKEVMRAGTVRFNCTAAGRPPPDVAWYKDGQPLVTGGRINLRLSIDGKRTELVISGATSDDAGVYQCFAQNAGGAASSWGALAVAGADAAPPAAVRCWPAGERAVRVRWQPPPAQQVIAYTVHSTPLDGVPGTFSLPGQPHTNTEELMAVEHALTPYRFQIRAYMQPTASAKIVASDMSEVVVCQGQGVPIKLAKLGDDAVLVSWRHFADLNPGVVQWILQFKAADGVEERNVTLSEPVHNYTLPVSPADPLLVRVLGSRNATWLHQDLSLVPWVSTATAGDDLDDGEVTAIPHDLEVGEVGPRGFTVTWRCAGGAGADRLVYMVCARRPDGTDDCKESDKTSASFEGLQPSSEYEVRVQARAPARALGGAFSQPYLVTTQPDGPQPFKNFTSTFVNATSLRVSWGGEPGRYTVHYSAQLRLPVEQWNSLETSGNTVLITGIDPTEKTYVMVTGDGPHEHSKIETILPLYRDPEPKELQYEYTRSGVRVSWSGVGPRAVCHAQNITRPVEQWACVDVAEPTVELTGLEPSLPTFVMVTASGKKSRSQVLSIEPRPTNNSSLVLGLGISFGLVILCVLAVAAVCIWRKRKRPRSPVRSRRRNVSANEGNEEDGSEMKNVGGRLANGGGSKDAGEPLLNGHVHITENPTSKTPNGKMKKGRRYEAAFDVSRGEDPDTTAETVLGPTPPPRDAPTPPGGGGTPRNSFNKLPDDNMNSELTRSTFQLDNSKIQPTLQPNG